MNKIQLQWNGWYKLLQLFILHTFGELPAIKEGNKLTETSDCIPVISEARKDRLSILHSERLLFLVAAFTVRVPRRQLAHMIPYHNCNDSISIKCSLVNVVVVVVVTYKDLVEGVGKNTREVKVVVVVVVKAEVVMAVAVEEVKVSKLVAEILMEGVVKNTWEVKVVVVVVVESEHSILEEVVVKAAVVMVVALKEELEVSKLVVEVVAMVMLEAKKQQIDDI
ncbi:hypothetical protein SO802_033179 [Lithocarpus litseifolius]|uniref:Uncharacterized protein n=1 Tax=Lithocarpus litseifolius TaxID=425828 RepID=A0AAW2BF85_9ROSI